MVIFLKENGSMIKQKAMGFINIQMGHIMRDSGKMTCSMGTELKFGQMAHGMKVITF